MNRDKTEKSWIMYDWANSAYSVVITTAIFPIYFKSVATEQGVEAVNSTAYLAYTVSIATLILAILGPILGAVANYEGMKKKLFFTFFTIGFVSTFSLALVPSDNWLLLLILYIFTAVGFHGANIFYDSFLVDVTTYERMDYVSAKGFGLGYIGSTIPFLLSIIIIISAQMEWISLSTSAASRLAFVITALWWATFTIPMLRHVTQQSGLPKPPRVVKASFQTTWSTLKQIPQYRHVFIFLIAYFFYIDGVGTIIAMSTAYGTDLNISATTLLIVLFVTQLVAAPFAILYGRLAKKHGPKRMLYVGISVYILVCIYAFFLKTALDFWILAMLVATSQGGIQSLSRSYFAQIIPKEKASEFFGFYNIFGKFASIMGPLLVAMTAQLTGSTAYGVFSLVVLFIIGGILLRFVPNVSNA
ncbi:MFS transporter [Savagea faecisuis]|uniref:MFS transporter n=1 Tax=Savagea faecisuis TaxID=1274803 RepID=A0ABW3GT99_9BACL